MTGPRSLAIILLGILAGGVGGFVAYQYHQSQKPPSPFEANKAFLEEHYRLIGIAEKDIEKAIEAYKGEHGALPGSLDDLHLTNFPSGVSTSYLAYFEYSSPGGAARLLSVRMGGIGVRLASRGDFRGIEAVFPNSAASKANVMAGDYVLQINGNDVTQLSHWDFVSTVQGLPGTSVTLTLRKRNSGKLETVTLMREPMEFPVSFMPGI
jgi:predicted metalloprotease with PDZ domain